MDQLKKALEKFHKSGDALIQRAADYAGMNEFEMHVVASHIVHMAEHMDRLVPIALADNDAASAKL